MGKIRECEFHVSGKIMMMRMIWMMMIMMIATMMMILILFFPGHVKRSCQLSVGCFIEFISLEASETILGTDLTSTL